MPPASDHHQLSGITPIFSAAAHAQRAADFLHGLQAVGEADEEVAA